MLSVFSSITANDRRRSHYQPDPGGGPSCLEAVRPIRTLPSSAPAKQQGEDGVEPEVRRRSRSDGDLSLCWCYAVNRSLVPVCLFVGFRKRNTHERRGSISNGRLADETERVCVCVCVCVRLCESMFVCVCVGVSQETDRVDTLTKTQSVRFVSSWFFLSCITSVSLSLSLSVSLSLSLHLSHHLSQ